MSTMSSASERCCSMRALSFTSRPARIHGHARHGNGAWESRARRRAICCGSWESPAGPTEDDSTHTLTDYLPLPTFAFPQFCDVRDVVFAVPCINNERFVQRKHTHLRMAEFALPLLRLYGLQDMRPAIVQGIHQRQRNFQRRGAAVSQLRPTGFFVRLDGGFVFGESQLESNVGIHMAVGHVVDDLLYGPTSVAVGSFDLLRSQSGDGGS